MNTTIKRIDPRRPFTITAAGIRRITLGGTFDAHASNDQSHGAAGAHAHGQAVKPLRTRQPAQRTVLVAAHSDRGALDEHTRQALAAAALIADAQTQVALVVFGELKDDAAALGADRIVELATFDRRRFAPERELQALAACVAQIADRKSVV